MRVDALQTTAKCNQIYKKNTQIRFTSLLLLFRSTLPFATDTDPTRANSDCTEYPSSPKSAVEERGEEEQSENGKERMRIGGGEGFREE